MSKRLQKELAAVTSTMKTSLPAYQSIECDDSNILIWTAVILPTVEPFNKGAFKFTVTFPPSYPFKPPTIQFLTKIYHPNIDEEGSVCLGILKSDNWKPATQVAQVLSAIGNLIDEPNPSDPINNEAAKLYVEDTGAFKKKAAEWVKTHAIKL
eukprot:CFRG7266T1